MPETAPQPASIHMGHGQMVDIAARSAGQWEVIFSEAGKPQYQAPPLAEVEADAIDTGGNVHPLTISAGDSISSVLASGQVAGAYRVRVRVVHGTHFHTRESFLPGAAPLPPRIGKHGGALIATGAETSIEIRTRNAETWELLFLSGGAVTAPPPAADIIVQAVGPKAEDYQIRNLAIEPNETNSALLAIGKIRDATHARITINIGGTQEIRSAPIIAA